MATKTEFGWGLGVASSLVSVLAAVATAVLGYEYAVRHAAGESARTIQIWAGVGFGVSIAAAMVAVVVVHVYRT